MASEYNYTGLRQELVDRNMRTVLGSQSDRRGVRWVSVRREMDDSTPQLKNERLALETDHATLVNREQSYARQASGTAGGN